MKSISLILLISIITYTSCELRYSISTKYLESKPTGASPYEFAENLKKAVTEAPQPSGYCFKNNPPFPLTNAKLCGSGKNIGWIFTFNFDLEKTIKFKMEFGTDFGYGAATYIDNVFYSAEQRDMWWAGDWNSIGVFRLE